nr:type 4a pilus biogenesis protein PilO [Pseudomonadota bacterium]
MNLSDLNNLDLNNAGRWPLPARIAAAVVVAAAAGALGYWWDTRSLLEELDGARRTEQQLRDEFVKKQRVMVNIDAYRAQIEELNASLDTMLRQLPTGTEMPDLLEDISNTGRTHGLDFELFRPQSDQPRDFYAAKPIAIRARASYHQFGAFVSSIAALPRIVTLENVTMTFPQRAPQGQADEENLL